MRGRIEEMLGPPVGGMWVGHLPRPRPPLPARPLAGRRAAPALPDPGLRRPVPADQAHPQGAGARRGQAGRRARSRASSTSKRTRGCGPSTWTTAGGLLRAQDDRGLPRVRGGPHPRRHAGLRRPAAVRPRAAARPPGHPAPLPGSASATSWWTSSRTPTPSSTPGCACWPGTTPTCSRWATTTSPSTAGAGRGWRTSSPSSATIPGTRLVRLEQNYRSTATILNAANALIAHNPTPAGQEPLDRGRRRASRSAAMPPSTRWTRRASWSSASATTVQDQG